MNEGRRNKVLAQLHHKLLGEPFEQPTAAEVEEVAWWEACALDRVRSSLAHAEADMVRERDRADGLVAEVRRLREALTPFAQKWTERRRPDGTAIDHPNEVPYLSVGVDLAHCQRAAEVLK